MVVGGGVIGSCIASRPERTGRAGDAVVIERERTGDEAAPIRLNGGVRQRGSRPCRECGSLVADDRRGAVET